MRHLVVGTAGHIDHGKSELVRALTGTNPDRLKEEQERGITIDIGFAHLDLPDVRLAFVDVPGHERFVKNMLAGASGIDLVLLVVAADESIKPQTREHFDICRLLGIRSGLIALTKIDLVDSEIADLVSLEIAEFVRGSFLEDVPVVPVSSRTREGIPALLDALARVAARAPERRRGELLRLPVDRAFTMKGFGTVVTGTLASGSVSEGEEVECLPSGHRARVRGIQVHGLRVALATAGERTALNLQGVSREDVERGEVLVRPGSLEPAAMLDAHVAVLSDAPAPLKDLSRVRFHAGTTEVLARVRVLDGPLIGSGSSGLIQLRLESPVVACPGDRFIIRRYSPARTIGGGEVIDNAPAKHGRNDAGALQWLRSLQGAGYEGLPGLVVAAAGMRGVALNSLASRCGLTRDEMRARLDTMAKEGQVRVLPGEPVRVVSPDALASLGKLVTESLRVFHAGEPLREGLPREDLRARLRGVPPEVFRAVLDDLLAAGQVKMDLDVVSLASHRVELDSEEQALLDGIEGRFAAAGLDPPDLEQVLSKRPQARPTEERLLRILVGRGRLHRLPDGRYIHAGALATLRRRLHEFRRESETIDIAAFKDLAGVSRKNAIPLLEFLDAARVTVRRGNERYILPER